MKKHVYPLKYGDLFVINSDEIHKASIQSSDAYERVIIMFDPAIPRIFNSDGIDLLNCFINRPKGEQNKISLSKIQIEELMGFFAKISAVDPDCSDTSKLLKLFYFIELLIFINKAFMNTKSDEDTRILSRKLEPILEYIDGNLGKDLSLRSLEDKFYINKFYLSSLFKKDMGINIHEYITLKRISKAKIFLSEGYSITEVCQMSGFGDYSHFIRLFKTFVGTSPGQYKKNMR